MVTQTQADELTNKEYHKQEFYKKNPKKRYYEHIRNTTEIFLIKSLEKPISKMVVH